MTAPPFEPPRSLLSPPTIPYVSTHSTTSSSTASSSSCLAPAMVYHTSPPPLSPTMLPLVLVPMPYPVLISPYTVDPLCILPLIASPSYLAPHSLYRSWKHRKNLPINPPPILTLKNLHLKHPHQLFLFFSSWSFILISFTMKIRIAVLSLCHLKVQERGRKESTL